MSKLNRGRFGKQGIAMILCTGLVLGTLSGCGGKYAGVERGDGVSGAAVSGSAVSENAVSGSAVSEPAAEDGKTDEKTAGKTVSGSAVRIEQNAEQYPHCTDTNLYYTEELVKGGERLWQVRLDGTNKKCVLQTEDETDSVFMHYVDKDWLYYEIWQEYSDKDTLYRAPIRKDKDGYDEICISEAEKLITEELMYSAVCETDSHYFFYETDEGYIKYDLQRKKKKVLSSIGLGKNGSTDVYRIRDRYVIASGMSLYTLDADGTQCKKVSDDVYDEDVIIGVQGEQAVYYAQRIITAECTEIFGNIKKCDGKKVTDFATKKQQEDAVKKALHADKLDFLLTNSLFCQDGRIYIQYEAGWEKDGTYHMEYVILSQKEKNDSGLRYEKELTECMKSHVKTRKGKWADVYDEPEKVFVDSMAANDAHCIAMADGRAYLNLFDYEKGKGRLGCYELASGKFQWVEREDALFYRLGYEMDLGEFIWIFADGYREGEMQFDVEAKPHSDEDWDGEFVENP